MSESDPIHTHLRNLSPLMKEHGQPEIDYRMANMREGITGTLAGIKAAAEAG